MTLEIATQLIVALTFLVAIIGIIATIINYHIKHKDTENNKKGE